MSISKLSLTWTKPKISPKGTNARNAGCHCYVWFRYYNHEKGKWSNPIRRKPVIDPCCSKEDHYEDLVALRDAIIYKLKVQKWNPINNTYPEQVIDEFDEGLKELREMNFCQAMDFAYVKKKPDWRKKSSQDYNSIIKYLKQAAAYIELHEKKIIEFRLPHFRLLLDTVKQLRKLSDQGYNKYREYLSSLVGELIQWEVVDINLVHHVKTKKVVKHLAHRPPTKDELSIIMPRIKKENYEYYRFLAVLYGCTLRPKEITRLKIKHLHKKEQVFRISYDAKEENLKTKSDREVVIPNWLMNLLMEMNLQNYNPEFYIFSTFNKYKSFLPGPRAMHPNTTNHWWRKIVKNKKTGLGMNVNQYSLKKLAGNDMVRLQLVNNADKLLQLPKMQMGHANEKQTTDYVQEHLEVMKDLVKNQMPVL